MVAGLHFRSQEEGSYALAGTQGSYMIVFWRRMMWMLSMMWLSAAPALAQDMHAAHAAPVYESWDGPPLPADWIRFQGAGFTIHLASQSLAHERNLFASLPDAYES